MRSIFIGMLLIFLDFNININASTIGLIPDFIGFIFMVKGLDELSGKAASFARARPFAVVMGVFSGLLYALDLFGVFVRLGWLGILLGLAGAVISLYITYTIIEGVRELEEAYKADLNSRRLTSAWKVMAIFQIIMVFTLMLPLLSLICALVSLIASIVFLVAFNNSKKLYETLPPAESAESFE